MIYISKDQFEKIVEQAKNEFPNECCGFLAGTKEDNDVYIKKVYALRNTDESSEHFSMDPKEQFDTVRDIRNEGLVLLGNYHSHPFSPSRPSEEDKRLAFDPNAFYGILSLHNDVVFNIFKIVKGDVEKLEYKII
ncbi:MAG: M67 family metallopeptidase [Bacillota bacterium]|nr:M67 family metallopeptidase [Bacillota bacterium]